MKKIGLYDRIHAKRKRIAAGSGEKMRKVGSKGAPTKQAFINSAKTASSLPKAQLGRAVKTGLKNVTRFSEKNKDLKKLLKANVALGIGAAGGSYVTSKMAENDKKTKSKLVPKKSMGGSFNTPKDPSNKLTPKQQESRKKFQEYMGTKMKPTVTPKQSMKTYQKGGGKKPVTDSTAYFNNMWGDAYKQYKSGKYNEKKVVSQMKKASEGLERQLVKKGINVKKTGGSVKFKRK